MTIHFGDVCTLQLPVLGDILLQSLRIVACLEKNQVGSEDPKGRWYLRQAVSYGVNVDAFLPPSDQRLSDTLLDAGLDVIAAVVKDQVAVIVVQQVFELLRTRTDNTSFGTRLKLTYLPYLYLRKVTPLHAIRVDDQQLAVRIDHIAQDGCLARAIGAAYDEEEALACFHFTTFLEGIVGF